MLAKAIKKYEIPRHKVVLLSKVFGTVGEEPGLWTSLFAKELAASKDYVNHFGTPHYWPSPP